MPGWISLETSPAFLSHFLSEEGELIDDLLKGPPCLFAQEEILNKEANYYSTPNYFIAYSKNSRTFELLSHIPLLTLHAKPGLNRFWTYYELFRDENSSSYANEWYKRNMQYYTYA